MVNCNFCKRITFDKLPSEDEDALSHQHSLDALEVSAESCRLCELILWAAGCSLATMGGMVCFKSIVTPSGQKIQIQEMESNYSTMPMFHALENGAAMMDPSGAKPDLREPKCLDLRSLFPDGSKVRPWLFGSWYKSPHKGERPWLVGLGVRMGTGPGILDAEGNSQGEVNIRGTFLRIRTEDTSIIPGRLRTDYQGSEIALQRIQNWVADCDKGHRCDKNHSCPRNKNSPAVPTRLLDIDGRKDIIRVVEIGERRAHYVALSHCWGTSHRIKTTVENYGQLQEGISLDQLPETFQDAVLIARKLKVPYLWIDSLCIIQDDILDWEHEASKMGNVYAHAYLTVSAMSSSDDSSGCFAEGLANGRVLDLNETPYISCDSWSTGRRAIPLAAPLIVGYNGDAVTCRQFRPFATLGDGISRPGIYVTTEWMPSSFKNNPKTYLVGGFGRKVDPFEHEPLSKRCWTLQERLLSPRTLHFGTQEMYWECQCWVLAEDGARLTREFPTLAKLLDSTHSLEETQTHDSQVHRRASWLHAWFKLVEEYTARNLTRDQDKLPALSGIVGLIAAKTGDSYIAGLWRRDLIHCLFWSIETIQVSHYCDDPNHDAAMPPATKSKVRYPDYYRAPSWSWASLDGKVEYGMLDDQTIKARCLEVQIFPAGTDRFGKVQLGWICLEGPLYLLHRAKSEERDQKIRPFTVYVKFCSGAGTEQRREVRCSACFDHEPYFPSFALFLGGEKALILKANGLRTFTRIGIIDYFFAAHSHGNNEAASLADLGCQSDSNRLTYSVEEIQAAEVADGSPQTVTIF